MKLNFRSRFMLLFWVFLITSASFVQASWLYDWIKEEHEEFVEYISIQGKEIGSVFVQATIEKLSLMAKQNPKAFLTFFVSISDGNASEVPGEVLQLLKDLGIVDKDAVGISDLVKVIASWAISLDASGNPYVGALQDLINDGLNNGTIKMHRGKSK